MTDFSPALAAIVGDPKPAGRRAKSKAFAGLVTQGLFVWLLPVVVVTNTPARLLFEGFDLGLAAWLFGAAVVWFAVAVFVFHRGLRRYASASS